MNELFIWNLALCLAIAIPLSLAEGDEVNCTSRECQESEGIRKLLDQKCGQFSIAKVAGGTEINLCSRPWLALIVFDGNTRSRFSCGGTLIHKRYVLTAAHCVDRATPLYVRLGEHKISSSPDRQYLRGGWRTAPPEEDIGVDKIFIHEHFDFQRKLNDIALIKLSKDVEFKSHIKPICLPINATLQHELLKIEYFTVTGWGKMKNGEYSDVPNEAYLPKKPLSDCSEALNMTTDSTHLCAGDTGIDSCHGDSGGPLADIQYYGEVQSCVQYGIVSYGITNCDTTYSRSVYTNVISFMPWIAHKLATT